MNGPGCIVACLGASATAARGSYDWVRDLEQRPANTALRFYKFAADGDLAYNGLARVPQIIAAQPAFVIVLLGNNDVLASVSPRFARIARRWKRLPQPPTPQWYWENMRIIVRRLKQGTSAPIALCSLIPFGEAPHSRLPFQQALNQRVEEYSAMLRTIAAQEGADYLPLYERMLQEITASPCRAFTGFRALTILLSILRAFFLPRLSLDEIGRRSGWRLHTDGLHLNTRGGTILADLVQDFLRG